MRESDTVRAHSSRHPGVHVSSPLLGAHRARGLIVLSLTLALAGWFAPVAAQTRFIWPSEDRVDVTSYETAEECLAVIRRMQNREVYRQTQTVWLDTMPYDRAHSLAPLPRPVTETARACGARYTEPGAPVEDFAILVPVYLAAERDADAEKLTARRLAAITGEAKSALNERAAVLDSLINIYLEERPLRLARLEWLTDEYAKAESDRVRRAIRYAILTYFSYDAGDTARARRGAERVLAIVGQFTPAERRRFDAEDVLQVMMIATRALASEQALLDSLRRSTASYVALARDTWARGTGMRAEAFPFPYNEPAPPITADFWFGVEKPVRPRPTPGRVSLVVFVNNEDECFQGPLTEESPTCWNQAATLRRLAQRFPALEITLVAHTRGRFAYLEPPPPAEEAELIRQWLLGAHRIPAALAVSITPSWRLPDPDGRPIRRDSPVMTAYSFGKRFNAGTLRAVLIDEDGVVVHVSNALVNRNEAEFSSMIEALLTRAPGGK